MGSRQVTLITVLAAVLFAAEPALCEIPGALATATTDDFVQEIQAQAVPLEEWIQKVNSEPYQFICLGEVHSDAYRERLAKSVFSQLKMDYFFLESTREKMDELLSQAVSSSRGPSDLNDIRLLGPPIGPVLNQALMNSPGVRIQGVEMTAEQAAELNLQRAQTSSARVSRDGYIARNILNHYKPGESAVALYGASHCAKNNVDSGWMRPFYSMLQEELPKTEKLLSVKVILGGDSYRPPLSAEMTVLLYLQNTPLHGKSFVIPNMSSISRKSFNGKMSLTTLFESYDALVVLWP